ncbi:BTAD domain-containing putative transcriptional regulator [Microlunatus spumicola]|uniref:BTAD domain-containing putative transcriptional regulator n=1 Tax=Microlunatus spumicola TaxID=81499 RepID=A0ABP6WHQ9_9ACTN
MSTTTSPNPTTISTPDRRLRVFVSSTLQELADERRAVRQAITAQRLTPVMFELGARPHAPRDLYRAYLAQSDVFVGIYARSYGWVAPDEEVSGLEDEYLLSGDRPKLIYVKTVGDRDPRLQQLLDRVKSDDRASYQRFSTAEELVELLGDDLAVLLTERFAGSGPAAADALRPGRLPVPPTPVVGRQTEVHHLVELLRDPTVHLVSLVGPGGMGKTRVALEAATAYRAGDGGPADENVWFVDLTPIEDPALVVELVASAFGVRPEGDADLLDLLVARLAGHRALLVLDNFEQVVGAAPQLGRLLAGCPELTVLVTTRTLLGLRGEHAVPLAPLSTPLVSEEQDLAAVQRYAAVQLFVDRVRQVRPGFVLTGQNTVAVVELCRLLDGIPLALELAAAQLRILSPAALLGRLRASLSRSLDLDGDLVDTPARQRTLRATLEWSHSLLGPAERALLARLSVFAHTWTLEAAEAVGVVTAEAGPDLDATDTLSSLVGQSLVTLDDSDADELRFSMLATVRGYARERLAESGEQAATGARLTAYLRSFAEVAGAGLTGPDNRRWAGLVDAQLEDLRTALQRGVDGDDAETTIRIAAPLFTYWWNRGLLAPMRTAAEQAAVLPSAAALPPDASALLLWARGMFRISSGLLTEADPLLQTLLDRTDPPAPPRLHAFALAGLGLTRVGAPIEERRALLAESVATLRALGDGWGLAFSLSVAGQLALQAGEPATATAMHTEALAVARSINQDHLQAQLLDLLGLDAMTQGDLVGARRTFVDAADLHRRLADAEGSANCLDGFAAVALAQGRPDVAARLIGASAHARELAGVSVWPGLQALAAALAHGVRSALGDDGDRQGRSWGASLPVTQALAYAVQATEAGVPEAGVPETGAAPAEVVAVP